jgi:hypothetical protein
MSTPTVRLSPSGKAIAGIEDHKVLVDATDATPGFLADKIVAGPGVALSVLPGADEKLSVSALAVAAVPTMQLRTAAGALAVIAGSPLTLFSTTVTNTATLTSILAWAKVNGVCSLAPIIVRLQLVVNAAVLDTTDISMGVGDSSSLNVFGQYGPGGFLVGSFGPGVKSLLVFVTVIGGGTFTIPNSPNRDGNLQIAQCVAVP